MTGKESKDELENAPNALSGLPADLASVLRDQSVIVSQDAAVFELIASWANAPSTTASAPNKAAATEDSRDPDRPSNELGSSDGGGVNKARIAARADDILNAN